MPDSALPPLPALSQTARMRMQQGIQALQAGRPHEALRLAQLILAESPAQPDPLQLSGIALNALQRYDEARDALQRAQVRQPGNASILVNLGNAQRALGDTEAAYACWRRAAELAPRDPTPRFNLGRNLQLEGRTLDAVAELSAALELAPDATPARILLADAMTHLGRFDDADFHYREALWRNPACGDAWRGLANIKMRPLSTEDREQLELNADRADIGPTDRIAMRYALGKVNEDQGRYPQAFAALSAANAELRALAPWDARAFKRHVDQLIETTPQPLAPVDAALGHEAILIVGLPRSGSTLFEQILAAHPQVEGASELSDLDDVLGAESARRGQPFPQWVPAADAQDWLRLGQAYLQRTARWRTMRPRFTDKMPENWRYVGILRAMLPGATVIDARRDALETGWSCFKQQFYRLPHFSCDLNDIVAYLRDCERAMTHWRAQAPDRIRLQSYEALLADPEREIGALLAFCGLPDDARCREFHRAERSVRTPSASQVRQPLRGDTARAAQYGGLLDPLRAALAR